LGWAGAGGGLEQWRSDAICLSNRLEGKALAPERGRVARSAKQSGRDSGRAGGGYVGGMWYVWIG
jgi:hypothetical protein